jgi:hypothetical protein
MARKGVCWGFFVQVGVLRFYDFALLTLVVVGLSSEVVLMSPKCIRFVFMVSIR